jgi:hypothetical protein
MNFEEAMTTAAKAADETVSLIMGDYSAGNLTDEDDISAALVGGLRTKFSSPMDGLTWSGSIVRHRKGVAAEEKLIGADIIIHVSLNTSTQKYSKGTLIQATRTEPQHFMGNTEFANLQNQCNKMLAITPASFVFNYAKGSMRCGSATRIAGASIKPLETLCSWTSYRFFLELFRCPIGDELLTSARVRDLPVPLILKLKATGQLSD